MMIHQPRSPNHIRTNLVLLALLFTVCTLLPTFSLPVSAVTPEDETTATPTPTETVTNTATTTNECAVSSSLDADTSEQYSEWDINNFDPTGYNPAGCVCTATLSASSSGVSGKTGQVADGAKIAYDYLVAHGLSSIQALGVVGNLRVESGDGQTGAGTLMLNTNALNSGGKTPNITAPDQAYGIVQWRGSRKTTLQQKANYDDIMVQLDYLWEELSTGYATSVLAPLQQATTIDDAAMVVNEKYEIPCSPHVACLSENARRAKAATVAAQLMGVSVPEAGAGASTGTASPLSATSTANCGGAVGTISGLPDGGVKTTQEAWAIAQLFINDLNIIRVGKGAPFKNITDTSKVGSSQPAGTPGMAALGSPCFYNASDCTQCYALSAWFVDKFTTLKMGTVTRTGDGVVAFLGEQGVATGTTAQVYSVFSVGRHLGDNGAHTGVVVGIVGNEAITVENNFGGGGELIVAKRPIDGGSFDSGVGGRKAASFAYVSGHFAATPKTFSVESF